MAHLITSQDSVLLLDKSAWHGLGTVKKSSDGGITEFDLRKEFGWPVTKERLYTDRMEETDTYATIRTILNPDGSEKERIILGAGLSERYQVLQNDELIQAVKPILDQGCVVETAGTLNRGRRVWILARLQTDMLVGHEVIQRYIMFSNDHTGAESARVGFVPIRVVCHNTLSMAESSNQSSLIKIRHGKNVSQHVQLVANLIDTANGQFLAYGEQLEALMDTNIDQADLDKYVKLVFFPKLDMQSKAAETAEEREAVRKEQERLVKLQNVISELFQTEPSIVDSPDANGTVYGAYQAVNHYINHIQPIGPERRLHSIGWGEGRKNDLRAMAAAQALVS